MKTIITCRTSPFTILSGPSFGDNLLAVSALIPAVFIHYFLSDSHLWTVLSYLVFAYIAASTVPDTIRVIIGTDPSCLQVIRTKFPKSVMKAEFDVKTVSEIKLEAGTGELDGVKVGKRTGWRLLLGIKEGYAVPIIDGWVFKDQQRSNLADIGKTLAKELHVDFTQGPQFSSFTK